MLNCLLRMVLGVYKVGYSIMNIVIDFYKENYLNGVNKLLQENFSLVKESFHSDFFYELVALYGGEVVGYTLLTKVYDPIKKRNKIFVDYVCVSSNYRRMGIGRKLLDEAYMIAKRNNALYLQLTCSRFRMAAHALYLSCNFVKRESDIFRKEII